MITNKTNEELAAIISTPSRAGDEALLELVRRANQTTLKWTNNKPTAPGKYWLRYPIWGGQTSSPHFARIDFDYPPNRMPLFARWNGHVVNLEDIEKEAEWAGPIVEPPP